MLDQRQRQAHADETWSDTGLEFDSAGRAKGAKCIWAYRGLWSKASPKR